MGRAAVSRGTAATRTADCGPLQSTYPLEKVRDLPRHLVDAVDEDLLLVGRERVHDLPAGFRGGGLAAVEAREGRE